MARDEQGQHPLSRRTAMERPATNCQNSFGTSTIQGFERSSPAVLGRLRSAGSMPSAAGSGIVGCRNGHRIEAWLKKQTLEQIPLSKSISKILGTLFKSWLSRKQRDWEASRRMLKLNFSC
jgi:hypothetical protein